ncbi:molecular chaperone DnaJ [Flavobacterium columnare NBRC 100251 = ATCC 23463]|uniref:DnaJ-class molecular chaperone n=2 Tax=Flavobacterium columnare TaxID=996 RepID=G8X7X7_FLACA|nr:KTSC domain-containing protein [Flavobacterium columnare]AEW87091.1 DnaJ-class molecular chaperone [Flavobacterium columnare ATCC 49512]AMO21038.1 KTSC domain-containing protein [Flavobacterium columnare]ANO47579.1 DnaJ-class molecular chaperone [Flavobacterium columnare]APT21788.1 molecular chaperone DnaJ [Flavobacterium columnare]AUX19038.1 molecular chaperone DnaJ [Flavobacterium columnare]
MRRVVEYRKLLEVDKNVTLKELKTIYRNAMKESHPDKFANDDVGRTLAEEKSKDIINAYHFLVSIANETRDKNLPEYEEMILNSPIADFYLEKQVLFVTYLNGITYEYIGVPKNVYIKMINAESPNRFAKRHIYGQYLYRKSGEVVLD